MALRSLFAEIQLKATQGLADLKKFNDELDDSQDKLGKTEKGSKSVGVSINALGKISKRAGKSIAIGIGAATGAVAALSVGLVSMTKDWSESADQVGKSAQQIGVNAQELQRFQFAAGLAGAEAEDLNAALLEMSIRTTDALEGTGGLSEAAELLGLEIDDLAKMKPEDRFLALVDAINRVDDASVRRGLADKIFGGDGVKIINLIETGSEAIREAGRQLDEYGEVLDDKALQSAADFNDELARQGKFLEAIGSVALKTVAPAIVKVAKKTTDLAKENKKLISQRVEKTFERIANFALDAIPAMADLVDNSLDLIDKVGGIDSAIRGAAEAWAIFRLAALAAGGPVGAIIAGVGIAGIGIGRLVRETELREKKRQARDVSLRDPDDPTKGLSTAQLDTATGRELEKAARDLRAQAVAFNFLRKAQDEQAADRSRRVTFSRTGQVLSVGGDTTQEIKDQESFTEKQAQKVEAARKKAFDLRTRLDEQNADKIEAELVESRAQSKLDLDDLKKRFKEIGEGGKKGGKREKEKGPPSVADQLAAAFGGRVISGPAGGATSLGTTINQVDARVFITVGTVENNLQLPRGATHQEGAEVLSRATGQSLQTETRKAFQAHRSLFIS